MGDQVRVIQAPEIPETNINVNKSTNYDEYDEYINKNPPIEEQNEDYEKELSFSRKKLRQRKKELEKLIKRVNVKPLPLVVKKSKGKKKEEAGFLRWLGGIIGCTER